MFKNRGGRVARLVDMAIHPRREEYRPPAMAREELTWFPLCDADSQPSAIDKLVVRILDYRGKIVFFAITQVRVVDGKSINIARIDCCWGTIHKHLFDHNGEPLVDHEPICEIPSGQAGQIVVNDHFPEALKVMNNDWEANVRRWSSGRL